MQDVEELCLVAVDVQRGRVPARSHLVEQGDGSVRVPTVEHDVEHRFASPTAACAAPPGESPTAGR
jgi:hypothetical protein